MSMAEKEKREREWCDLQYKRHNESMNKSMSNYQAAIREKEQMEVVT